MHDIGHSFTLEEESFIYPCFLCDFSDPEPRSLQDHVESFHKNVKKELNAKDSQYGHLNEVKKYQCNECNFNSKRFHNLQDHIQSIHEGVKYPCDQCNFKASEIRNLRNHKKKYHVNDQQINGTIPDLSSTFVFK